MSPRAVELRDEVLALSLEDRAGLVIELLDSLDDRVTVDDLDGLARVWSDEFGRRSAQLDAGEVRLDSWDDLMAKVAHSRSSE
jgi:putative addiction module component (TIGR02574 family)